MIGQNTTSTLLGRRQAISVETLAEVSGGEPLASRVEGASRPSIRGRGKSALRTRKHYGDAALYHEDPVCSTSTLDHSGRASENSIVNNIIYKNNTKVYYITYGGYSLKLFLYDSHPFQKLGYLEKPYYFLDLQPPSHISILTHQDNQKHRFPTSPWSVSSVLLTQATRTLKWRASTSARAATRTIK
ncbi:hypothetical protein JG688_00005313 [Phytophthora aleatoria]|uniref:Uncharacterized protein n=1 Tax=Phytophthora aleatoria TaxID=2496075 RepID=A0A8J5IMP0_9STRA|nr:hypothetical protein JG688_00005313 [Phytophthora aleatoria]